MTQAASPAGRARPAVSRRSPRSKVPREGLVRLEIEAEHCPQVFLRALGLIAKLGLTPLAIDYARDREVLRFELVIEGLSQSAAETLLCRTRNLVMVREARLARASAGQ